MTAAGWPEQAGWGEGPHHSPGTVAVSGAHVGDQLVVGTDRIGIVVGVPAKDGSPPYIIKWLKDGHIAMMLPDQYARIVPGGQPVATGAGTKQDK